MNHLSDEEIQEYLDGLSRDKLEKVTQHLKTCSACRHQVAAYKRVYSALEEEPAFSFPANFIDNVVNNVTNREDKKYQKWETILLIFSIIQVIGFAIYFIDFRTIFTNIFSDSSTMFESALAKITELGNGFLPILIIAAIIISFYGILDKLIGQLKHN